jgi:hypothetical protein
VKPGFTLNLGLRWDYFSNENNKNFDGGLGLLALREAASPTKTILPLASDSLTTHSAAANSSFVAATEFIIKILIS